MRRSTLISVILSASELSSSSFGDGEMKNCTPPFLKFIIHLVLLSVHLKDRGPTLLTAAVLRVQELLPSRRFQRNHSLFIFIIIIISRPLGLLNGRHSLHWQRPQLPSSCTQYQVPGSVTYSVVVNESMMLLMALTLPPPRRCLAI